MKETKIVKILAAEFDKKKMHLYDAPKRGKHPVHMIEGGRYLTEDERVSGEYSDMGWFNLNQKEYDYFKSQLKTIEIEIKNII